MGDEKRHQRHKDWNCLGPSVPCINHFIDVRHSCQSKVLFFVFFIPEPRHLLRNHHHLLHPHSLILCLYVLPMTDIFGGSKKWLFTMVPRPPNNISIFDDRKWNFYVWERRGPLYIYKRILYFVNFLNIIILNSKLRLIFWLISHLCSILLHVASSQGILTH